MCVLFGDAAGAVLLGEPRGSGRILDLLIGVDGRGADLILTPAGESRLRATHETVSRRPHFLQMNGKEVFKVAAQEVPEVVEALLTRNGCTIDDLALLVPHQASLRMIEAGAKRLGIPLDRVMVNVDLYGNTAVGSVPLALDECRPRRASPSWRTHLPRFVRRRT